MYAMWKTLASLGLISLLFVCAFASSDDDGPDNGFTGCNCEVEGFFGYRNIMETQRVSDFLIAIAYFSIPIELLYFVSCSNVPFKWVLFEFIAFIVLCGMTHLLNGWTYEPHPFQLMLALTIFKFLTALVSFATAITLITLIPLLLKVKVREFMLKKRTRDLGREMGVIKQQKDAGWHVRILTQEIRKSLDRHTILYTTLDKLSDILDLHNCAIWMPDAAKTVMNLTHQLKGGQSSTHYDVSILIQDPDIQEVKRSDTVKLLDQKSRLASLSSGGSDPPGAVAAKTVMNLTHQLKGGQSSTHCDFSIPIQDPDIQEVKRSDTVKLLDQESRLASLSSGGSDPPGAVAAIRMPMLRVSDFKGGTPEMIQTCYAILVLVLPGGQVRSWTDIELEIVKVVADQVAVALSHAAVFEESLLMREKLAEQNRALQLAKQDAMRASQARNLFQTVMSKSLRKPMHSIMGLLSIVQDENLRNKQRVVVNSMVKTSNVLSMLINDVMDDSSKERFPLEMRSFRLHSLIKEIAYLAKCLCSYKGYGFKIDVDKSLPDNVMGDERRVFQVILHMVGNLLNRENSGRGGSLMLRIATESGSQGRSDQRWATWRSNSSDGYLNVKFEIGINDHVPQLERSFADERMRSGLVEQSLSSGMCRKLVELMQGKIWVVPNPVGFDQSMSLVLRFQLRPSIVIGISETGESSEHNPLSNSLFRGLQVLLADEDDTNRVVTRKLLEKLGCIVSTVATGSDCINAVNHRVSTYQMVILDLHMPDIDGFEVVSRIRKTRSRNWPLIIALTVAADEGVWERCIQMGINGVIHKPVVLQGISDELRRVLIHTNNVTLTLWNELATGFPLATLEEMEQPVIIGVGSCRAKRHAGTIQLSSTPATNFYFNPEVPEADHIRQVYNELITPAPRMQLPPIQGQTSKGPVRAHILPLAVIMGANPHNTTQQQFTTEAVIVKIDKSKGWYFNRCRECGNPIEESMPHRHCQEPGTQPLPNYSYCFRATLADVMGSIVVACYSPAAHSLLPKITEVLSYVPDQDPYTLPPIIKDLENTKHIFQIHLGKGSRKGYPNFILDSATDALPLLLPEVTQAFDEGSSSTPIKPVDEEHAATEITPGSLTPPTSGSSPVDKREDTIAKDTESPPQKTKDRNHNRTATSCSQKGIIQGHRRTRRRGEA